MPSCFTCGLSQDDNSRSLLREYKRQYEQKGVERYFYKTETNGATKFCRKSSFNSVYKNEIKPNFHKGAEFAHISEFG